MFGKILDILVSLFKLKIEIKVIRSTEDVINEIYITNYTKNHCGSFAFWVHGDTYEEAAKKAVKHLLVSLKWSYKVRITKKMMMLIWLG